MRETLSVGLICDPISMFSKTKVASQFPHDATAEWESLPTIEAIANTWQLLGYRVEVVYLDSNFMATWTARFQSFHIVHSLVEGWGSEAREAWIPALCELSGVPYIGTGPMGMSVAMRKGMTKTLCEKLGIRTAPFFVVRSAHDAERIPTSLLSKAHFIKPDCEGSGMGVSVETSLCLNGNETSERVKGLLVHYPDGVIVEEWIDGPEYTTGLLGSPFEFLPVAQIEVPDAVYGLAHKGKSAMEEKVTFPKLPKVQVEFLERSSRALAQELNFQDFVRFDFRANERGEMFFLEANPLAGLSKIYSVLPKMAEAAGYSYLDFFKKIADSAATRLNGRHLKYGKHCRENSV